MARHDAVLRQINAVAETYRDPLAVLDWERLSLADWWLPPEALSLAGVPAFECLPEDLRRRLSHYELLHFLHVGLWLEGLFMAQLAAHDDSLSLSERAARLHAIREEAGHSLMFLKLMEVSGLSLPACAFRPPKAADFLGQHMSPDGPLHRLAVVVGEEVPDRFNRRIRSAASRINPLVLQLVTLHGREEARHIVRARLAAEESLRVLPRWRRRLLGRLLRPLLGQFNRTLFLPAPALYELAGLGHGPRWRRLAAANPLRQDLIRECVAPTLAWLARMDIVDA